MLWRELKVRHVHLQNMFVKNSFRRSKHFCVSHKKGRDKGKRIETDKGENKVWRWKNVGKKEGKNESRFRHERRVCPRPSQTASDTPAAASRCVWSSSSGSPVWWLTAAGLWGPEGRSHRTRWDSPLGHSRTSHRIRTSRSPWEGQAWTSSNDKATEWQTSRLRRLRRRAEASSQGKLPLEASS